MDIRCFQDTQYPCVPTCRGDRAAFVAVRRIVDPQRIRGGDRGEWRKGGYHREDPMRMDDANEADFVLAARARELILSLSGSQRDQHVWMLRCKIRNGIRERERERDGKNENL